MNLIDGKATAKQIKMEIATEVAAMIDAGHEGPHLAAVIVGDDPASHTYVNGKEKACQEVGMTSSIYRLPEDTSEKEVLEIVDFLNNDDHVDGFIVQLPLPKHIGDWISPWPLRPSATRRAYGPPRASQPRSRRPARSGGAAGR